MKFENWTSIADGCVSCIHNSWELESPLIDSLIFKKWLSLGVAILGLHAQTAARTCGRELGIPGDLILSNEQFVAYYGIRHIRFNVAHCKCTDMKFENWTSIADGYVSCIHNSWELNSPLIDSWKIFT